MLTRASSIAEMAAMVLALPLLVSAAVAPMPRANGAVPSPWVSVDSNGRAVTVTPTVTVIRDPLSTSTLSPPPGYLTETGTYTLTVSNTVTTTTGLAPVASATGTGEKGEFIECSNYAGLNSPFCYPHEGSTLNPGKTYYVTWDLTYFSNSHTTIEVQADYSNNDGFTTGVLLASQGFFAWSIDSSFLTDEKQDRMTATFYLAYTDTSGNSSSETRIEGPTINIANPPTAHSGPPVLAIALPVVLGIVALALLGFCVWSWRRHGHLPLIGGGMSKMRRSSSGYGVRKSHSERMGGVAGHVPPQMPRATKGGVGVELTDRDSWSPTSPGQNVFREELRRQETGR